jgi:hypothetical protein
MPRPDRRPLSVWYQDLIQNFQAWRTWHKARTHYDLLAININRIIRQRNELSSFAPDGTREMLTALLELNSAGVFTCTAQRGRVDNPVFGSPIEHRAAVTLICDDDTQEWIENALLARGVHALCDTTGPGYKVAVFELHNPDHTPEKRDAGLAAIQGIPVTRTLNDGVWRYTGHIGAQVTAAELHRSWPARPDAVAQLYRGWQITIYDNTWGPSNLFADLTEIARNEQIRAGFLGVATD